MTEGSDTELAALRVIEDVLFSRDVVERHMRGGTIIDRNAHAASVRDAVRSALRAALPARSDAGLRTAVEPLVAAIEKEFGPAYPLTDESDFEDFLSNAAAKVRAALAAADHGSGDGLDVAVLGDAIVAAVRAERAPIGYKGDGWPAYWEKDRPATVLAVSSLAARVAAEYARLAAVATPASPGETT